MLRRMLIISILIMAFAGSYFYFKAKLPPPRPATPGSVIEASVAEIKQAITAANRPLTLVNFWASWCAPCKKEFPYLTQIKREYAERGLQVIFISIDDPADREAAEGFLREQKVDVPSYYKGRQPLKFVTELYPQWSGAVPTTLLFGSEGQLIDAWEGETTLSEFTARIEKHLPQAQAGG